MPLLDRFLAYYQRSGLRGSHRLTNILASRIKALQCLRIETKGGPLFADLRISSARGILAFPESRTGEDLIIEQFVNAGDIVFDIGAHLGFYTLLLSKRVGITGSVIAFEPNPELLPSLKRTLSTIENAKLFQVALSDMPGKVELYVPEDASMGSLKDWTDGIAGSVHAVQVEMLVLDEMLISGIIPFPSFIKCDVEGAELKVFRGGRKVLDREHAPVILFEVNESAAAAFGSSTTSYFEFLENLPLPNYTFFKVMANGLATLDCRLPMDYANILAVPELRLESVKALLVP